MCVLKSDAKFSLGTAVRGRVEDGGGGALKLPILTNPIESFAFQLVECMPALSMSLNSTTKVNSRSNTVNSDASAIPLRH